jgi:predicted alpha/beta-fold hydrolase
MNSTVKINVQHYSINEIINILGKKGFDVDLNHIRSCIRENIITPLFYINSLPAYAFEKGEKSFRT